MQPETTPDGPDPVGDALAELSKLTAAGAAPDKVIEAVGRLIAGWAEEPDMNGAVVQARIGTLWDSTTKDAAELEEQISDATGADAASLAGAKRMLAALRAATRALTAANERF